MSQTPKRRKRIAYRNKSPYGWWIASYLERFEFDDEDRTNAKRRCTAWENTIILKAKDRDAAYRKAEKRGRLADGNEFSTPNGRKGVLRYEGLTGLLPIYEELEDGAEILWNEHRNRSVRKVKSLVKQKHELAVFDDAE